MKLRMCSCRQCRYARRHNSWERYKVRNARRSARHNVKILLACGNMDDWENLPESIWIPYNG